MRPLYHGAVPVVVVARTSDGGQAAVAPAETCIRVDIAGRPPKERGRRDGTDGAGGDGRGAAAGGAGGAGGAGVGSTGATGAGAQAVSATATPLLPVRLFLPSTVPHCMFGEFSVLF